MTTTKAAYEAFAVKNLRRGQNLTHRELTQVPLFTTQPPVPVAAPPVSSLVNLNQRSYRSYSNKDLVRVIGYHYGSTTDFRYVRRTVSQVARQLRMPWSSV